METTTAPEKRWLAHDRFETMRCYLALTAWPAGSRNSHGDVSEVCGGAVPMSRVMLSRTKA
jgi:hypothetical protein